MFHMKVQRRRYIDVLVAQIRIFLCNSFKWLAAQNGLVQELVKSH